MMHFQKPLVKSPLASPGTSLLVVMLHGMRVCEQSRSILLISCSPKAAPRGLPQAPGMVPCIRDLGTALSFISCKGQFPGGPSLIPGRVFLPVKGKKVQGPRPGPNRAQAGGSEQGPQAPLTQNTRSCPGLCYDNLI